MAGMSLPASASAPASANPACVINCVHYDDEGIRHDISLDAISDVIASGNGFVWVGLYDPNDDVLLKLQEEFCLHDLAVEDAGNLARSRYQRNLEELDEHLRNGEKILIDITAAQRNELDQAIAANQVSQQESKIFGIVKPDEEHMLWPFDGEYWRDELGFYRQVVESACGR